MNLVGKLLIAPPAIKNSFWYKTVVMVTEHHNEGSMGLVLNKRSPLSVNEFAEQLGTRLDLPGFIYQGGPINVKSFSFLHSPEWECSNTMIVNDLFSVSSAEDILPRMALGDRPKHWRMFLGVCGWSPRQLLGEIKGTPPWNPSHSWCLTKSDTDLVFGSDTKDQWCSALDQSALEFAQNVLA
jgi:putative transcriptional regulator